MVAAGERHGRRDRLSRSADFERVYRQGRSHAGRYLVVYSFPRDPGSQLRLGLSVGRRIGGAVERNRVKRLIREAFWARADRLPAEHDFVVVARPECGELVRRDGAAGITRALGELLDKASGARGDGA